jgi:hypothetical protein
VAQDRAAGKRPEAESWGMMDKRTKLTVAVWDQLLEIAIYQKSNAWIAVGEYMGETIETTGPSASVAVRNWQETARQKGNIEIPPKM